MDFEGVDLDPGSFDELMESLVGACHAVLHDASSPSPLLLMVTTPVPCLSGVTFLALTP